ncbi:hypothetical protein SOCE26_056500 [Sorangium cellulosum]|uniref:Uncharacterized protein n=1 Tax=Sorangium cellulosum TaxID=56 RepID=A0A2L0EY21_SORCE|nr:hypothetical protein [Sorangium cellulosum]AUX44186.1 hypothetical protein SOCE26_056500 [Sorangium cellulosum]
MATTFAALIYRPAQIPDRALAQGFAVALGGWAVAAPRLFVAPLPGVPGFSAAFYASGEPAGAAGDELDHLAELFEDELSPPVAVLDAAAELGHPDAKVFALVFSEEVVHDDGWRVEASGYLRHFVREGEEGLEAGVQTPDRSDLLEIDVELPEGATEQEERDATDRAIRPHRGSTFLAAELGAPVLGALIAGLFAPERRIDVRLVEPGPASIEAEVRRLNRVLRREDGRGAPAAPPPAAGVAPPATYEAFARAYDWADPADPQDLYRELAIGAVEGTLRFLRDDELRAFSREPGWEAAAGRKLYPIARLSGSALGGAPAQRTTIALGADGEQLWIVRDGASAAPAGPTFGELLRYLSLGWSRRSDAEEDFIGALMLRARLRSLGG